MLNQLIQSAARKSHDRGHKLDTFSVYRDGAVSACKLCDNHVRVTTTNGEEIKERCPETLDMFIMEAEHV